MYDPGYDMRSHQASHYGARHDRSNRLFTDFIAQLVARDASGADGRRRRQATPLQRREFVRKTADHQLVDWLFGAVSIERMRTQRPHYPAISAGIAERSVCIDGHQHLATVSNTHQGGGPRHRRTQHFS